MDNKFIWKRSRETVEKHCGDTGPTIPIDREFLISLLATFGNEIVEILTRKHVFWGAGERDCPRDIKAPNGELHTLRCKVCGQDGSRDFCLGAANCVNCDGDEVLHNEALTAYLKDKAA